MSSTYPSPNVLNPPVVSNFAVQVAGPNLQRVGLYVFNPSATVTLWVIPTPGLAVANAAVAIQPLQGVMFGPPNTPSWTNGMNAIASAAGSNLIVILEYYS